jgi:hypothetical protein
MSATTFGMPGAKAWAAAQVLAAALRAQLTEPVTRRRWRRKPSECPWWCAADHRCTARLRYPSGEHRSHPLTWRTPYGVLIATRVQTLGGTPHLDLRASVQLPADEDVARWQGQHLPVGVDLTIRAITARGGLPGTRGQEQGYVVGSSGTGPSLPPSPVGPAARRLAPVAGPPCQVRASELLPLKAGTGQESFVEPPAAALPAGAHALA